VLELFSQLLHSGARRSAAGTNFQALTLNAKVVRLLRHLGVSEETGALPAPLLLANNLDRLLAHYGLESESPLALLPAVQEELLKGRMIHAIKAYRVATGADLREAKEAVEALAQQLER
jgi:hypothetical protein